MPIFFNKLIALSPSKIAKMWNLHRVFENLIVEVGCALTWYENPVSQLQS